MRRLRQFARFRRFENELRLRATQLWQLFAEPDLRIGVAVLLAGVTATAGVLLVFPGQAPSTVVSVTASASASFAGAYLSYSVVTRHLVGTERQRIDSPSAVCDRYAAGLDLLTTTHLGAVDDADAPDVLPVVVSQSVAANGAPLDWTVERTGRVYEFPPSLRGFLELRLDALSERFEAEGKFNARKARLDDADSSTLRLSETTYFRTFCTNFAPDLTGVNGGPTLRAAYDHEFVDDDGLTPLEESPFSNHLGGGGIVVTADGYAILGVRAVNVTVGERTIGNSFGGNFEYGSLADGATWKDELRREACEELTALRDDDVRAIVGLGLIRRVDWLGKPDVVSLVFADTLDTHDQTPEEFYGGLSVDLKPDRIDDVEELFDPDTATTCVRTVLDRIESSNVEPSVNVELTLELWLRTARAPCSPVAETR